MCVARDKNIGGFLVLLVFVLTVYVDDLTDDLSALFQLISRLGRPLQGDTYHIIGPHLPGYVNGKVVAQASVHQYHVALAHGCEGTGYAHARPHGLCQHAAVPVYLGVIHYIGSHTGKGNGQTAEAHRVMIALCEPAEQLGQVLTLYSAPHLHASHTGGLQLSRNKIGVVHLPLAQASLLKVGFV